MAVLRVFVLQRVQKGNFCFVAGDLPVELATCVTACCCRRCLWSYEYGPKTISVDKGDVVEISGNIYARD